MLVRLARALAVVVFAVACTAAPARAQDAEEPTSDTSEHTATAAPAVSYAPSAYHWLAAGLGIGVGILTIGAGSVFARVAFDMNAHALDPLATQRDAIGTASTANDLSIVATVLWVAGAAVTAIGLTWSIVLAVAASANPTPAATASVSVTPFGITLGGTF